jgi:serine/threonine protein kinase/tetratricopeptide (TPR) repeat protein
MTERTEFLSYALEHQFPHPIAAPFRCAQTATEGSDRAVFYLATLDGFLRFSGAVLLSDFFAKGPSPDKLAPFLPNLLYPRLTKWSDLVFELARQLSGKGPFMPELTGALVDKGGKATATRNQLHDLAQQGQSLLESKDSLLDPAKAIKTADELEAGLLDLLGKFTFLERYSLALLRSHAAESEDGFRGFLMRWMGHRTEPLPIAVEFAGSVPENRPLLLTSDGRKALELAPFMAVSEIVSREHDGLFVCAGMRHENAIRLENFSTSRFLVHDTELDGSPIGLGEYMSSWGGGGSIATLSPADATRKRLQFKSRLLPTEKVLDDRYKTLGFMGRGGIGAVYRVYDMEEATDKAVKILYPDLSRNEFFTRYFIDTGKLLSQLDSKHLVPIYEAGYSSALQENHIVMSHMRGGSLGELLARRETLGARAALRIAIALLSGIGAVHEGGLVHGGIHPGNILFDENGEPHLADFGILRLPSSRVTSFRPLERLHSLRYAAPELLLGGQASGQSDLYSAAIVIFEMLTGQVPSKTRWVPPSELIFPIPENLDVVLRRALAPAAEQRHANAAEFSAVLEAIEAAMGPEYDVAATAQAQQLVGHLCDVQLGHTEQLDLERAEKMESGDFEGAARLLQLKVDELWDIDERVYWMQELAGLYFEKMDLPGKAVSLYRDCLELTPDNPVAVRAIMGHFERTEQWEELAGVLEELKDQTDIPGQRAEYLEKLVELHHARLEDALAASRFLEELVDTTGAHTQWLELLVQLKEEAQDWEGAARALEHWKEAATEPEDIIAIMRRLAAIYHHELENHDAAVLAYEHLVGLGAADNTALNALRNLYRGAFSYAALAKLLRKMVKADELPGESRVELYQELGEILSSYLYNTQEAVTVWNELLTIDSSNQTALSYLERLYLREGQHEAYLGVLKQKAEVTSDPVEKAAVLLTSAQAHLEFLGDAAGARVLLEEGQALDPGHEGIEQVLERIYTEHGDAEAQGQMLLERLEREKSPQTRLEIFWKLTNLFQAAEDNAAAFEVQKTAFAEASHDPSIRQELEKCAGKVGEWEGLITFYMERLSEASVAQGTYLAGRIAKICEESIEDSEKALYALETAIKLRPESDELNRSLLVRYRDDERWHDLAGVMIGSLQGADETRRAELFEEVALLIKNRLGTKEHGRKLLEELVAATEEIADFEALRSLLDACRELEQWQLLVNVATRLLGEEEDARQAQELRLEIGRAYLAMAELDSARKWLEEALEKTPNDTAIQGALEETLAAAEDWEALARTYKQFIPFTSDAELRASYLEKAAQIEIDVFEQFDSAIDLYRQLITLVPDQPDYGRRLAEALKRAERYTELTWQYEQMSQKADGAERLALLRESAEVNYEKLSNPDAAIETMRAILRETPEDGEVFERVKEICLAEKRFETLLRLLGERSRQVTESSEKLALKVEMARLSALDMGLLPPARNYLTEVLGEQPGHQAAYDLFRDILERQEDWKGLADLMSGQFAALEDEAEKVELGLQLATLQRDRLDLKVASVDVLEKVWELVPDDARPGLLLAKTYADLARWDKTASLLAILRERLDQLDEEDARELVFLSAMAHEALLERASAITYYRKSIELGHRVSEAEEKLAILLYMDEDYEAARDLMGRLLDSGKLSAERTKEFKNLAADMDRKLGRRDKSREHLEGVLAESPNDAETIQKLLELCKEEGDNESEADYLQQLLDVETDPERRFPMQVRLAELLKNLPDRLEDAAIALERALELKPDSKVVAIGLGDVYSRLELWDEAAKALREAEELERDPTRKAAFAMAQASLFIDHAEQPELGEEHLMRALQHDPSKFDAFTMLEQLVVGRSDWEAQKNLYLTLLEQLGETISKDLGYTLNLNLGRILLEKFGDSKGAVAHLEAATRFKPDELEPKQLAANLYLQIDDGADRALEAYKALVQAQPRDIATLQQLRKTYGKMKRYDEAWYVASALVLLGAASEKEKTFYKRFSSSALKIKPRVLDTETLRSTLLAKEEEWELSEIIRILFERMSGRLHLQTAKSLGLSKKTLLDDSASKLYGKLVSTIAKVLGIPRPQTHLRETSGWLVKEGCYPSVLVMSPDLLENRKGKALRFELARTLSLFLAPHQPVGLLDREMLHVLLGNLLKLVVTSFPEPAGDTRQNLDLRKEMDKAIPTAEKGKIRDLIGQLRDRGGALNVKRWFVGVEKASCRAGLLFANDLPAAVELVQSYPVHLSGASREELTDDLLRYAVSDEFAALRKVLGITVL